MTIETFGKWGDPRAQAQRGMAASVVGGATAASGAAMFGHDELVHGMTATEVARLRERFSQHMPNITSTSARSRADKLFAKILPKGASLAPSVGRSGADSMARGMSRTANFYGPSGTNSNVYSYEQPYIPDLASPDRYNFPRTRSIANECWRLFYERDPIIGMGTDMFAEMMFSNYQLTGEGVDGEIKDTLEYMDEVTRVRSQLPFFSREFDIVGEVVPHLVWSDEESMWTHLAFHNPDQLDIIHSPFLDMDPVIEFRPDRRLRQIVTSDNPMLRAVRESMPPDLVAAISSGQGIPLSPVNCTFLARKAHPYNVRGTSTISRMWRILMFEDALFTASIAIAKRSSAPLKVVKLGDPATGWIPSPEQEQRLLELIAQSEHDPASWISWNYCCNFELVGVQERTWKVEQSADFIEKTKLMAMGLNRGVIHGEVTYASAASGLTVMLQRLKARREFVESAWLYPKYYRPVSEMNSWIKPTQAELSHRVRTKRSKRELREYNRYIIPRIEWDRPLDPSIDSAMIQAYSALSALGAKFSKTTLFSTVNKDYERELDQSVQEAVREQKMLAAHPELQMALAPGGEGGAGGGGGGGILPGMPPSSVGLEDGGGEGGGMPPPPPGGDLPPGGEPGAGQPPAAAPGDPSQAHGGTRAPAGASENGGRPGVKWDAEGKYGSWGKDEAMDLVNALRDGEWPEEEPWSRMVEEWSKGARERDPWARAAIRALKADPDEAWEAIQEWLLIGGYPPKDVRDLEAILQHTGILKQSDLKLTAQLIEAPDDFDDAEFFTAPRTR